MKSRPYEIQERQANGDWETVSTWETEDDACNDLAWLKLHHPHKTYCLVFHDIEREEKWIDVYGCKAEIIVCIDGRAHLSIRTERGSLIHAKTYNTYRGAKIAMGKSSDGWERI